MNTMIDEPVEESPPDATMAAAAPGFGERLRTAREAAGLSAAQAADKLHCDVQVVHFLEAENVLALGAAVYARGHLRRYAELLKLPAPELVALYDLKNDRPDAIPDLTRISRAERPRDPNKLLRWVYVVAGGLISLFAVWAVLQNPRVANSTANTATATPAAPGVASAGTTSTVTLPSTPASAPATVPSTVPNTVPSGAPAAASPTATQPGSLATVAPGAAPVAAGSTPATTTPASTVAMQPTPTQVKLALRAGRDCWTEVYDADGRQLFFDIARRGSRQEVSGTGPLRIVLGNAAVMRLEIAGRELTIPAEMQRKGTAFINVSADGRLVPAR